MCLILGNVGDGRERERRKKGEETNRRDVNCVSRNVVFILSEDITSPKLLCFSEHGGAMQESRLKRAIA